MNNRSDSWWQRVKSINLWRIGSWIGGVFAALVALVAMFSSILSGIAGLIISALLLPPVTDYFKKRWNLSLSRTLSTIAIIILIGIFGANLPPQQSPSPVQVTDVVRAQPVAQHANTTPLTDQQKIDNAVTSQIKQFASSWAVYGNTDIESDDSPTATADSKFLFVTINADTSGFWSESSTLNELGRLTSNIFPALFAIEPNIRDVSVEFDGNTTDQYGNTKGTMLVSYRMSQQLYSKINWSGFSDTMNDINLCAFLREQYNTMSQADQNDQAVGCSVVPYNLRAAETTVETSNPQYGAIPQY